jgi:FHA domain/Domain of unknown function (DUF4388)
MRVVLEASLGHFTAGELLLLIAARGRAGTLDATSGDKRSRVFFRDGKVIGAEAEGTATPESIVTELAGWTSGAFRVLDGVALPEGATPVALDVEPLVKEGERRASEERRLLELYPSDDIAFTVNQQPQPQGTEVISLRPDEFQLLFQIGNGKTLAQIREQARKPPFELYATLQRLQSAGLVSATGGGAAPEATVIAPPAQPVTRSTRKTRVGELKPKTVAQAKPLIATLTTETGSMHPLLEDETTIGREDRNTIPMPHGSISGRHARIVRTPTGFTIEDLGSRNGTFINSEPVTEKRPLSDGDIVRLGKVLLTFNIAQETRPRDTTKPEVVR